MAATVSLALVVDWWDLTSVDSPVEVQIFHMERPTIARAGLDDELLRPSGALLAAQISLGAAIEHKAVAATEHDRSSMNSNQSWFTSNAGSGPS